MTSGRIHRYQGRILRAPGGRVARHEDCCCVYKLTPCAEYGSGCSKCVVPTPKHWTVVLDGIVACDGCINCAGVGSIANCSVDINGTFLLTQSPGNNCLWYNANVGPTQCNLYLTNDCSGDPLVFGPTATQLHLELDNDGLRVSAYAVGQQRIAHSFGSLTTHLGCDEVHNLDNTLSCSCPSVIIGASLIIGYSGSAVITPGDQISEGVRCPGGSPVYTDTDLSSCVGQAVELNDGVCYGVEKSMDDVPSDGEVTVVDAFTDCADACDDINSIGFPCP